MSKKIIIIENDVDYQCDTFEEIVKMLIDEKFYDLTAEEKKEKMKMKAIANSINNKMEIIDTVDNLNNIDGKFIIKDEITYILSLLITTNIVILERIDSNIFTKNLNKSNIKENYVIVNKFAQKLLNEYLNISR